VAVLLLIVPPVFGSPYKGIVLEVIVVFVLAGLVIKGPGFRQCLTDRPTVRIAIPLEDSGLDAAVHPLLAVAMALAIVVMKIALIVQAIAELVPDLLLLFVGITCATV